MICEEIHIGLIKSFGWWAKQELGLKVISNEVSQLVL